MRLRLLLLLLMLAAAACTADGTSSGSDPGSTSPSAVTTAPAPEVTSSLAPATSTTVTTTSTTTAPAPRSTTTTTTLDPAAAALGAPAGTVPGITMFRGNPSRSYYGSGPVPTDPEVLWRFPDSAMCGTSGIGGVDKIWCGTGWTGQPVVWDRPDGITEVIFGAFDKRVHFLDAATGEPTRPPFAVGDIVKGSVVLDPDGFPLLYVGSRVNRYMVVALDRAAPTEVWSLSSSAVAGRWNNDWDSSAVIRDGYLLEGGENSWWFAVELNRGYGADGLVTVQPEVVATIPAWSDETLAAVGNQQSIESSTVVFGDTAYFANGAGRIVGVALSELDSGEAPIVFDFWAGDDIDSTVVVDAAGMLYAAPQRDLRTARSSEVGQLVKLDPSRPDDPIEWRLDIPDEGAADGGSWATPALFEGILYLPTNPGDLLAVDTTTGEVVWSDDVGFHAWSSPIVVDGTLIVAVNCGTVPALRAYGLDDPGSPQRLWEIPISRGCLESTPAMWNGNIYIGSRDGYFYALGDR